MLAVGNRFDVTCAASCSMVPVIIRVDAGSAAQQSASSVMAGTPDSWRAQLIG
jgi:hypothetical protein